MIANYRPFFTARSRRTLLGALLVFATWGVGCSKSSDSLASGTTPIPAAQPSVAPPFKPADDAAIDARARETEAKMTDDERLDMIYSLMRVVFTTGKIEPRIPAEVPQMAGWVKGVTRLGVPDLLQTDAGLGIGNPSGGRPGDTATAFPAGLLIASTFNPALARRGGEILGVEARSRGFNVLLGGGMNLTRDPRHGRNFEYLGEDPWLAAVMAAESVIGTQSKGVLGMVKHVTLNSHETNKWQLNAIIDPAAHRESELLAFQIATERGNPAAMMCAYNKVNGAYACGNDPILNGVIKQSFGFKGFIMSDWKAVYGWDFALKGLDMHSGAQLDEQEWFVGPLREAYKQGKFPKERLSDMVRRILWGIYLVGADQWKGSMPKPDMAAHHAAMLDVARQGIVLLKNDGALPLATTAKRIAVIGGMANVGAMSGGGGSSQVLPPGGWTLAIPLGGEGVLGGIRRQVLIAPGLVESLRKLMPDAQVIYDSGEYPVNAAALAKRSDVVIVVANKFDGEGFDSPDLTLPNGQDALIPAVAAANSNTIVVLQTGNPVAMPWRDRVKAIVEAWYSGQVGALPTAEVLTGRVNPSGRLPITFPASIDQTPHPTLAGFGTPPDTPTELRYHEGAEVGYRWYAQKRLKPMYAFGHGLSYTTFDYKDFKVSGGETITATFTVTNTGKMAGADVPQIYLTDAAGGRRMRLLGFERVDLAPGASRTLTIAADPRLLATFDGKADQWRLASGTYRVALGKSAGELVSTSDVAVTGRLFGK
jgi:beta-glucosidase